MLKLLEIELALPEGERVHSSMGSVLHGALMDLLDTRVAERLHMDGVRPYSQYVFFDKDKGFPIWRIGTLTEDVWSMIVLPLLEQETLFLRQKGYSIYLISKSLIYESSYQEIADDIFLMETACRQAFLRFLTATSFKRNGQYVIFPETFLIIQSLLHRWNTFSHKMKLDDENLANRLASYCKISNYRLHAQTFSLEHQNIQGFAGNVQLRFQGTDMTNRLLGLLIRFASFAGVGIKTALGMGAVDLSDFQ